MAVKIRLMRIGTKKTPFYRVVAVDERKKRTGGFLELLGTYNPLTEPKEIILKKDRISWWLEHGAVQSEGYLRIIGQAPQRLPRKPKKEKKTEAKPEGQKAGESEAREANEAPESEQPAAEEVVKAEETQAEGTEPSQSPEEAGTQEEKN